MVSKHTDKIEAMSDGDLIDELETQNEWVKDDSFEFAAFGRGDNGFARDEYIAELYDEAVQRGLREPLPPREEDDSDFGDIKAHMESKGYEWDAPIFRRWGDWQDGFRRQIGYSSFEDAAKEWHTLYTERARAINRAEMWG